MSDSTVDPPGFPPGVKPVQTGSKPRRFGVRNTLVIRCKLADYKDRPHEPAEPTPVGGYETFFTSAGAGQGTVYDYLTAQMMGMRYYDADITPWYTLNQTEAQVMAARPADRFDIVRHAARAAGADLGGDVSAYEKLVVIVNCPSTASGDRGGDFAGTFPYTIDGQAYGVTVIGSSGFDLNGVPHEMLHGYGVQHGFHADWAGMSSASEYGDPHDVMSAFNNFHSPGPYGNQGANLSGARRRIHGWVPENVLVTYVPDDSVRYPPLKVELQPLGSAGSGTQLITIPVGDDAGHYYTVEHRVRAGWDAALPGDGVLIYEVRPDRIAYLMTRKAGAQGEAMRGAGDSWSAPLAWGTVTVEVDSADSAGATVRLSVA